MLFDLIIDTPHTIVVRIFHFSSSNSTPRFGLVHNRYNRVDGPRKSIRWTLYVTVNRVFQASRCWRALRRTLGAKITFQIIYSVMQSDGNSIYGDVVLATFNKASRDEENILDQKYKNKYVRIIFTMILILYNIRRKYILTLH